MRDGRDHRPTTDDEAFQNQWKDFWHDIQDWLDSIASDYSDVTLQLTPEPHGQLNDAVLNFKLRWFEHSFSVWSNSEGPDRPNYDEVFVSASEDNWWDLDEENLWKLAFFELFQQQDRDRVVRGANWTKPADERLACFLGPDDGVCLNCQRRIRRHFGGTEYRCFPSTLSEELELQGQRPKAVPSTSIANVEAVRLAVDSLTPKNLLPVSHYLTINKSESSRSDIAAACGVPVEWVPENHTDMTEEQIVEAVEANMQAASKERDTTCRCSGWRSDLSRRLFWNGTSTGTTRSVSDSTLHSPSTTW